MLQQFGAHALRLGVGLVDLVDRHDHRNLRRLGVIDGFDGLRHDAVIGRDHQDHDVGDLGAAGAHRGERGVAGGVDEGDLLAALGRGDLIRADMLGDAAGFARDDIGMAQRIEQRGLAVVDMAHHGDDRRARRGVRSMILGDVEQAFFHVARGDALDGVAHFLGDQLRGVGVDHVGDLRHLALLHQQADHVHRALGHAVGEFLNRDRFRNGDFADQLFLRLVGRMALEALGAAAERGDRTLAHFVGVQRGGDGQAAALLGGRWLRGGFRSDHGPRDAATGTAHHARRFIVVGAVGGHGRWPGRRARRFRSSGGGCLGGGFVALVGFALGAGLGFFLGAVAFFLGLLAGFGGFAFLLFLEFLGVAARGLRFGGAALFFLAHARVGKRAGARALFVFGQRAQHDAGCARGRTRGLCGPRRDLHRRCDSGWRGSRRFNRGCGIARKTALGLLLDHHLLGAAVTETLAHDAGLCARFQRQSFRTDAQRLIARIFRISHSTVPISFVARMPAVPAML